MSRSTRLAAGWAALAALALLTGCGGGARAPAAAPGAIAGSAPTVSSPSPSPPPAAASPPPAVSPAPPPQEPAFAGSISLAPAARVRFGPGLDMPVVDLDPYGTQETFDGWFTRADEAPMTDAVTGRIEAWSRDWYRLTGGRGWVHAGAVRGLPPAGTAQAAWSRPASAPASIAGIVPIELDRQDQNATCEVASLKMVLTNQGVWTSEQRLLALIGIDARRPEVDDRGLIVRWGDPDRSFVGDPDGRPSEYTGYGVYAGPVAMAAQQVGGRVLAAGAVDAQTLYRYLIAGHPAVAWVTSDYTRGAMATWTAWDGATVAYSLKEHAVAVIGVTPTRVLIDDPWWGQLWKSRAEFETAYATFGGRAVVTY